MKREVMTVEREALQQLYNLSEAMATFLHYSTTVNSASCSGKHFSVCPQFRCSERRMALVRIKALLEEL